jgi:hypothetical protein
MLVAHDRRSVMKMTPVVQLSALQDATDSGGAKDDGVCTSAAEANPNKKASSRECRIGRSRQVG